MIPKHILGLLVLAVLFHGCCGASDFSTSGFCTGPTFTQSCEKSCAVMSYGDYSGCVQECKSIISSEGLDPDSCCAYEYTVRYVCDVECSYSEYSGSGTCVENCGRLISQELGIGLDECVVPV